MVINSQQKPGSTQTPSTTIKIPKEQPRDPEHPFPEEDKPHIGPTKPVRNPVAEGGWWKDHTPGGRS